MINNTSAPSKARFGVLAFLCAMCLILYLDRVCMSQAIPSIQRDLGLSKAQMALVASAFTLAYGLFEVPVGRLSDRFGARIVLSCIVLLWSLFTGLTGLCFGFWQMLLVRFLFGFGEAGAYPSTARISTNWFPVEQRGRYRSTFLACSYIGSALAPTLAAWLILQLGWRWNFAIFASFGVVWSLAFYLWFRDTPAQHPQVNEAERALIGVSATPPSHHEPIPWGMIFTNRNILLLSAVIVCSAFFTYLFFTWYADYLQTHRGVQPQESGFLSSMVQTGSLLGVLTGGWIADRLRSPNRRRWYCCFSTSMAVLLFVAAIRCESATQMSAFFSLCSFCLISMQPIWWAFSAEVGGKHLGAIFGFMNGMGTFGAMGSQLFFGLFEQWRKNMGYEGRAAVDPAFNVYIVVLVCAALCWALLDTKHLRGERD